jgi:RNA ligase
MGLIVEDLKKILNLGLKHPARTMEFAELKKGLFEEVDKGNINVIYHPDFSNLAIFKYSIDCVADRNWNKFTLMARGLILDLQKEIVVATPFVKFFNLGEIESGSLSIIEPDFVVSEKIDGSLCIMFNFANKWRVATAGSFVSDQALWATKWMKKYMSCDQMDITNTYLFEVVYPENKIVVQYNYEGLVLLSIIDQCGLEYSVEQLEKTALSINTRCVEFYNFSDMDSILKNVQTLGINQEGYVIRFSSGIRLKVKGDE